MKVSLESVEKLPARLGWKFICAPSTDDVAMEVLNADSGEVLMKVVLKKTTKCCFERSFVG